MNSNYLFLIPVFILYFSYGASAYIERVRNSNYFYLVALIVAILGNVSWAYFSKKIGDNNQILKLGLWWDAVVGLSFVFSGFVFGSLELGYKQIIGVVLILTGSFIIKT